VRAMWIGGIVLLSLACGGRGADARDAACERVCSEAEQKCHGKCPNGPDTVCDRACNRLHAACINKCDAELRLRN
jgi:hypothetical protein